jgi:hypothetical protein
VKVDGVDVLGQIFGILEGIRLAERTCFKEAFEDCPRVQYRAAPCAASHDITQSVGGKVLDKVESARLDVLEEEPQ